MRNKRDLEEIPDNVIADLEIHPVQKIDEVLNIALQNPAFGAQPIAVK
ncbi:Lon protease [Serratia odorifera]|uniref:Lon protease n=1 Tax=Serratia odorifera TaxID=618 RepID=A0A3S4DCT7_SEROD|nr:Lon protease [Serratia odorifera]